MSGSNFTNEIRQAMKPTLKEGSKKEEKGESKSFEKKEVAAGIDKPPGGAKVTAKNATAAPPPAPHQFQPSQQQAQGQAGLQQASDQFSAHMMPHGSAMPQSSGLAQAHSQIVNALAQRDMLRGH